jgi:tetratricopeptide (TPR) repeat protein
VDREIAVHARLAEANAQPFHQWNALIFTGMRALLEGRFDDAERHAEAALEIGARQDAASTPTSPTSMGPNARMMYGVQLFNMRREQGRLLELGDAISDFARTYPNLPVWRCATALLHVQQGRTREAHDELTQLSASGFDVLPRDGNWLIAVTILAEVAAALGDVGRARTLRETLAPYADRVVVVAQGASCRGSVAYYLGLLAATCADHEDAVAHLRMALAAHDALGARPYATRTRLALAASLRALGQFPAEVEQLLRDALAVAVEVGLGDAVHAAEQALTDTRALPRAEPAREPEGSRPTAQLIRSDDRWTVTFDGRVSHLRDAKGLHYLAALLTEPGVDHPAALLERSATDGGALRAAGRARYDSLRQELLEAQEAGDDNRSATVREQMAALAEELTGGGSSGRAEQARVNVTRALRAALGKVAAADPALSEHLGHSVRTGASCSYRPDPRAPIRWRVAIDPQAVS